MPKKSDSTAEQCLRFCALFEAEAFVQLMLHRWEHPFANDAEFARLLVEDATTILRQAVDGTNHIESLPARDMNFIAAVWYTEWFGISQDPTIDVDGKRESWVKAVRRAFPSCFCSSDDLLS